MVRWKKVVTRPATVLNRWIHFVGYAQGLQNSAASRLTNMLMVLRDGIAEQYFDEQEIDRLSNRALKDFRDGVETEIFGHCADLCRALVAWIKKAEVSSLSRTESAELFEEFVRCYAAVRAIISFGHFSEPAASRLLTQRVAEFFHDHGATEEAVQILSLPLKSVAGLEDYFNPEAKHDQSHYGELIKKISNEEDIRLIRYIQSFAYYHEVTERICTKSFKVLNGLLEHIARSFALVQEDLGFYTIPEIKDLLTTGIPVLSGDIKERKVVCVLLMLGAEIKLFAGVSAEDIITKELPGVTYHDTVATIRGQVASRGERGVVQGRVKIIIREKDMEKMEFGDILVSPMTVPSLMPAIRLAGAIVTDEGGVICHAAIVSRELGIPCVIGTKVATAVLRDGDLVEVDAVQGLVRKIN